jgi:hypothetical protein
MTLTSAAIETVIRAALARGDLRVLLTRTQLHALDAWEASGATTFAIDCSRRWGKTIFSAISAFRAANARPGAIVRYVAPTKLHGRQFVTPAFAWVASMCPPHMRPVYDRMDTTWRWPNGSVCHLGSAETMGDVEAQVGTECDLAILDEAGKVKSDLLSHLHRSVLLPQFLTTNGRCLVASTPAITPVHYLSKLVTECLERGAMVRYTIDDCDHVPTEAKLKLIEELGGRESNEVKRELYCEHVSDKSRLIVPEWIDVMGECVAERVRPKYLDWYAAADFGFEDLTVVLWAWFDFERAQLVIEDELAMHRASGLDVGFAAREKEATLGIRKISRCADAPLQTLADMADSKHGPGIMFGPAMKDDADAALNQLRMLIQRKRIVIHPRCKVLIEHLKSGTWNANRTSFDRVQDMGHWDAIDALKYLSRVIDWRKNPSPALVNGESQHTHYIPPDIASRDVDRRLREAFR